MNIKLIIGVLLVIWIVWNVLLTITAIYCSNIKYDLETRTRWKNVHTWWFKIRGKTIGNILVRYIVSMWFSVIVLFIKIMKLKVNI